MDKSSYRYSTLLYSRYVIWYQTIVLTGVFLCCWPALVTFASFCLVVFCFVLLYSFTISCAYGCCSWYVLEAGLINLKATTVSIFHSTNIIIHIKKYVSTMGSFNCKLSILLKQCQSEELLLGDINLQILVICSMLSNKKWLPWGCAASEYQAVF